MPVQLYQFFTQHLNDWLAKSHRPLPWKGEKDPYLIWLSEIILQQTRVEQGRPYFERFRRRFPNVRALADAPEDEVMKNWEGLGYYSRARNLHAAAKYVAYDCGGQFPSDYQSIRKLKGVGPYTAAAIASFAYELPYAVVDGNVYRILSRFWGIDSPIDTAEGKKTFARLAQDLLEANPVSPSRHNQAMMDFGATQCTPKAPDCMFCPLREKCQAWLQGKVGQLPVKSKKLVKKHRYFHYLLFNWRGQVWIGKRQGKDIWRNLYEFPLLETQAPGLSDAAARRSDYWRQLAGAAEAVVAFKTPEPLKQALTHQYIHASFWEIHLPDAVEPSNLEGFQPVKRENLSKFAFPKIIARYLNGKFEKV